MNVAKHVVNLKYGLGLELNNYHFKRNVRFDPNPPAVPNAPVLSLDATPGRSYSKDKLAAESTVPIMLNFNFTPNRKRGFGFSAGISAGYLYTARNKTKNSDEGKRKVKDDFDLEKRKLSYIGASAAGPGSFPSGSYAMKGMYERGLDITPYNFGFRFSHF